MSGPIVRTGTTPKYWENWEQAFGAGAGKSKKASGTKSKVKASAKKKSAKKKSVKKKKK